MWRFGVLNLKSGIITLNKPKWPFFFIPDVIFSKIYCCAARSEMLALVRAYKMLDSSNSTAAWNLQTPPQSSAVFRFFHPSFQRARFGVSGFEESHLNTRCMNGFPVPFMCNFPSTCMNKETNLVELMDALMFRRNIDGLGVWWNISLSVSLINSKVGRY